MTGERAEIDFGSTVGSGSRTIGSLLLPDAIRKRMLLKMGVLFTITILAIGAVGMFTYATTSQQLTADTKAEQESAAVLQAETLGEWVERNRLHAASMSESNAVHDREAIGQFLGDQSDRASARFVGIYYVDVESGDVVASSNDDPVGTLANAPLAEVGSEESGATTHDTQILGPYRTQSGVPAVAFVAPIDGQDDRAIVIVSNLSARSTSLVRPAGASSFTHVVDSNGTIVLSHQDDRILNQNMGPANEPGVNSMGVKRGLQGETGYVVMDMGGNLMTMGFSRVPGTEWVVMSHIPKSDAFALRDSVVQNMAGLTIVSLLALGVVGIIMGRTTRDISDLSARARRVTQGDYSVSVESDRPDEVGRLFGDIREMRDSLQRRLEEAERLQAQAEALNEHLEEKAVAFGTRMQRCAQGDLTQRMDPESESEAMTRIANEFNEMMDGIDQTVARVQAFSQRVEAISAELDASSEEVVDASSTVSSSVQAIADGAARQSENLQSISSEMEELSTTVEEVASTTTQVANNAEAAAAKGRKGRKAATAAVAGMEDIRENSRAAAAEMDRLREAKGEIDDLLDIVSQVAEETNRLALNANIEAARSGNGGGEGFGVVAQQIRELAEESKSATQDIEDRLETVTEQAEESADTVEGTAEAIADQADSIQDAIEAFEDIARLTEETNAGVQEINSATKQQAASTQEVVAMVDEVAAISEDTSQETQNVAGAAEEQTSVVTSLADNVGNLADRSATLRQSLEQFVVSRED